VRWIKSRATSRIHRAHCGNDAKRCVLADGWQILVGRKHRPTLDITLGHATACKDFVGIMSLSRRKKRGSSPRVISARVAQYTTRFTRTNQSVRHNTKYEPRVEVAFRHQAAASLRTAGAEFCALRSRELRGLTTLRVSNCEQMFADSRVILCVHSVGRKRRRSLSAVSFFSRGVQALAVSSSESDHIRSRTKQISPPCLRDL
jgi:hypothetical protein